jgi:hypothetical protein
MNKRNWTIILLVIAIGVGGCLSSGLEGDVTAEAHPPELYLHNETNQTIYYIAAGSGLARVDIDLSDYSDWPTVAPGGTAQIPYASLPFYNEEDAEAWIYWTTENDDNAWLNVPLE